MTYPIANCRVPPNVRGLKHEVSLSVKHGSEAKSYDELAKANKLAPLEVELKRLEDLRSGYLHN